MHKGIPCSVEVEMHTQTNVKSAEKHMRRVKYLMLCFIPTMLDHVSLGWRWKYHFHAGK